MTDGIAVSGCTPGPDVWLLRTLPLTSQKQTHATPKDNFLHEDILSPLIDSKTGVGTYAGDFQFLKSARETNFQFAGGLGNRADP
jgi:hypothetical protein